MYVNAHEKSIIIYSTIVHILVSLSASAPPSTTTSLITTMFPTAFMFVTISPGSTWQRWSVEFVLNGAGGRADSPRLPYLPPLLSSVCKEEYLPAVPGSTGGADTSDWCWSSS